ncbi:MAG: TlpA family protein disulfide reductase [Chloroflexi bacterium]|nr:TlpA family protein disulfide reductase [Chloroflexota bacterium]
MIRPWRQAIAYTVVGLTMAALAVSYARALGPAIRKETRSACASLAPTSLNAALGELPSAAPDIQAEDYTGKRVALSAYRGKTVLLNFWGPWCPPCLEEMPAMDALARALKQEPFEILAVASGTTWPEIRGKFPGGLSMTVLLDNSSADGGAVGIAAGTYGTEKLPESYLIDKKGQVRYYFVNQRDWSAPHAVQCMRSIIDETNP